MKIGCALLLLLSRVEAFAPTSPAHAAGSGSRSFSSALFDMPPAAIVKEGTVPELKPSPGGAPVPAPFPVAPPQPAEASLQDDLNAVQALRDLSRG